MTNTLEKLSAFTKKLKDMNLIAKTSRSKNSTRSFYGKEISLEKALEIKHQLSDYYEAIKFNRTKQPQRPTHSLGYLLRCNAIAKLYHTEINLGLKIGFKRNYLEQDEVVWAWLIANHLKTDKPIVTIGNLQLKFHDKNIAI